MHLKSYAKINLLLHILGKRQDGYHDVRSVMQQIALADDLNFDFCEDGMVLTADSAWKFPLDNSNIVCRAAERYFLKTGRRTGFRLHIEKRIPVAAGLGGGSSNAAAALIALNRYFHEILSFNELLEIASTLGADVPFFLYGGTVLAEGIGEIITPLATPGKLWVLLINPGFPVITARIYKNLNLDLTRRKSIPNIRSAFREGEGWSHQLLSMICNDLETVVLHEHPELKRIKNWILQQSADAAAVSGSGGTVFGLYCSRSEAERSFERAVGQFPWVELTEIVDVRSEIDWGVGKR
ncbi:4-(cytidine 5'-diphospho)-2-C-methyl-D-erythritol kinase [bacterium]|nr:4-(cytidine 5'-diphospho)-2-C-methyl-D-erythritol kinase [candidate division CSSED10-310 bacterium]